MELGRTDLDTIKYTVAQMGRNGVITISRIYDANGNKMNLAGICSEVADIITVEQKEVLARNISKYEFDNDQIKLAHGILDSYKSIDSTSEQGQRLRKLLDNLMTKYQKSSQPSADDMAIYRNLVNDICK